MIRLNKFLSLSLNLSRRASDDLIANGQVKVNKRVAKLGDRVEEGKDRVEYNGKGLELADQQKVYLLLNKPTGYLSSKVSQGGAPTVYELLPKEYQNLNLNIAGRLDKDSCGLLMLTNDGEFLNQLTHPSSGKLKTYLIKLNQDLKQADLLKLKSGVQIGDTRLSEFKSIGQRGEYIEVILSEGRNRQIRRTFEALGYKVVFLQRTHLGSFELGDLKEGAVVESSSQ